MKSPAMNVILASNKIIILKFEIQNKKASDVPISKEWEKNYIS
jgi:hypothetical protein